MENEVRACTHKEIVSLFARMREASRQEILAAFEKCSSIEKIFDLDLSVANAKLFKELGVKFEEEEACALFGCLQVAQEPRARTSSTPSATCFAQAASSGE